MGYGQSKMVDPITMWDDFGDWKKGISQRNMIDTIKSFIATKQTTPELQLIEAIKRYEVRSTDQIVDFLLKEQNADPQHNHSEVLFITLNKEWYYMTLFLEKLLGPDQNPSQNGDVKITLSKHVNANEQEGKALILLMENYLKASRKDNSGDFPKSFLKFFSKLVNAGADIGAVGRDIYSFLKIERAYRINVGNWSEGITHSEFVHRGASLIELLLKEVNIPLTVQDKTAVLSGVLDNLCFIFSEEQKVTFAWKRYPNFDYSDYIYSIKKLIEFCKKWHDEQEEILSDENKLKIYTLLNIMNSIDGFIKDYNILDLIKETKQLLIQFFNQIPQDRKTILFNISQKGRDNQLKIAASNGEIKLLNFFKEACSQIEIDGALNLAAEKNHHQFIAEISSATTLDGKNKALITSARSGHWNIFFLLVEKGANINTEFGKSSLIAAEQNRWDYTNFFLNQNAISLENKFELLALIVKASIKEPLNKQFIQMRNKVIDFWLNCAAHSKEHEDDRVIYNRFCNPISNDFSIKVKNYIEENIHNYGNLTLLDFKPVENTNEISMFSETSSVLNPETEAEDRANPAINVHSPKYISPKSQMKNCSPSAPSPAKIFFELSLSALLSPLKEPSTKQNTNSSSPIRSPISQSCPTSSYANDEQKKSGIIQANQFPSSPTALSSQIGKFGNRPLLIKNKMDNNKQKKKQRSFILS